VDKQFDHQVWRPTRQLHPRATIDARALYEGVRPAGATSWPNPAEELTLQLLLHLGDNPKRTTFGQVQSAYMAIATEYYDDLEAAVAGPPEPQYFRPVRPWPPRRHVV
jgi:hypothetical protein